MAEELVSNRARAEDFDRFWKHYMPLVDGKTDDYVQGANWAMNEIGAALNRTGLTIGDVPITPEHRAELVARIVDGTISHKIAKEVFNHMWAGEGDVDSIIKKRGLAQISDAAAIEKIIDDVLATNQKSVDEFKSGKEKAFQSLVGQVMKASKGKANPTQVNEILKAKLG